MSILYIRIKDEAAFLMSKKDDKNKMFSEMSNICEMTRGSLRGIIDLIEN